MSEQLRWIPARVDAIVETTERVKQFRLFLPSFARFTHIPENANVDVKTPSGFVRAYPIVATDETQQIVTIEVYYKPDSVGGSLSMHELLDEGQIIEITAPFTATERSDDIDFYVKLKRKGVTIAVPKDVSIADAMRENNLPVNTSCEYGICGTCYTTVLSGELIHQDTYLLDDEKEKQDCMMICVSRGKPGTTIELDL